MPLLVYWLVCRARLNPGLGQARTATTRFRQARRRQHGQRSGSAPISIMPEDGKDFEPRFRGILGSRICNRRNMIKLYHSALSPNSRRVWITLLEKGLPFELVEVNLTGGEQLQPDFLAMNPYHHIPVLVDDDITLIESFAILDYLDAKYPHPPLMPTEAGAIATVRMVQMATLNELLPAISPLLRKMFGFGQADPDAVEKAKQQAAVSLSFFERQLGQQTFFGGDQLSLGDIVLGIVVPWLPSMEIALDDYPHLRAWSARLAERDSWKTTQPTPEAFEAFKARARDMMAKRQG